ncbi:serine/threonine-protein kinase [Kutzneria kofuensis]|uniref:non-specific serine/threonine protein kinase n=1 Tax=Kutzneria kofuensis TaxID=103725 RepID=A0A7W9KSR9_9PSEU|nr:serine/threonine-protein kinase [Kutzneria kofuensis]MBB5897244.1 serine/threonine protein kinase [Kutzneria kofuensis]
MGGDRLLAGRYRLGALVGRGAMAEVYRAYDMRLERPVAIKRFTAGGSVEGRRFEEEARLLAGLRHPGLVTVYEAGEDDGVRYLVMQLVNGPSLHAALERQMPTVDEVLALGRHLLPTLAYVHSRNVVHRDVKPSNILVDLDGEAFLADFGLAKLIDAAGLTRSGEIVGTAAFLAPEQVRGETATTAVDVYALGLVFLQCFTGRQEFPGTQTESALARLTRDPVIPDGLPPGVAELLAEMTSFDPWRRPTAEECARRWEELGIEVPAPRRSWGRAALAGVAGVLTIGLGLGVVLQEGPVTGPAPDSDSGPVRAAVPPPVTSTPAASTTPTTTADLATASRPTTSSKDPAPDPGEKDNGKHSAKGKPPGKHK